MAMPLAVIFMGRSFPRAARARMGKVFPRMAAPSRHAHVSNRTPRLCDAILPVILGVSFGTLSARSAGHRVTLPKRDEMTTTLTDDAPLLARISRALVSPADVPRVLREVCGL